MKHILIVAACLIGFASAVSAKPNTDLRPAETVLLYSNSFEGNMDPVYGKKAHPRKYLAEDKGYACIPLVCSDLDAYQLFGDLPQV